MRATFIQVIGALALCISLTACGGSRKAASEPVGRIQLGMSESQVKNILGEGRVVKEPESPGKYSVEVREYPAENGRVYVVRFIDGIVRRWEIQSR